ncbi:hypothetical protein DH2020_017819 [Rehmannia glutinosa]|uniref:Uncharacterized protein n=1 Tax=Rehmannia glutinosa TaxID=99300 RepID=A0ABR0WKQ6_REHGL
MLKGDIWTLLVYGLYGRLDLEVFIVCFFTGLVNLIVLCCNPVRLAVLIAYLNKKRKIQAELLEMPLPKHVCWAQRLKYESSSGSSTEQKKVKSSIFARTESDPESAKDSYSYDDSKTYLSYPKPHSSFEPSTSSASWDDSSSEINLYSLESRSLTKASSSKSEPLSVCEELHDCGLHLSDNYEDHLHLQECDNHADCSCSEYQTYGIELYKDLDESLYSNGVGPSNHVLSSGRWSVNQDSQQGTRKPTIDKEFEEYFSMLML